MKKICWVVLPCFIFFVNMILVAVLVSAVAGAIGMDSEAMVLSLSSLLSGGLTVLCLSFLGRVDWVSVLSLSALSGARSWFLLFCSFLLLMGLNVFFEMLDLPDNSAVGILQLVSQPLGIFSLALFGPFVEELVFREAMLGGMLRKGFSPRYAVCCSAFAFGVIHANPAQIPFAFLTGLLLGELYRRYHSLVLPFVLHVLNNGVAVLLIICLGEDASLTSAFDGIWPNVLLSLSLCLFGFAGVRYFMKKPTT